MNDLISTSSLPCWCGRADERLCFRTTRFGLVRCSSCGCYRIDPPPLHKDDESKSFYTDYYSQMTECEGDGANVGVGTRQSRFWRVVERVLELGKVKQTVADIGCGEGILCGELKAAGWPSVIGVDVSSSRSHRARQSHPRVSFYERPLTETDVATGSLDLVVMDNVIEHLPTPGTMLKQLWKYLDADGRLVLITPNMESGHFRLLGRRWTPELSPHSHIFLFTQDSIRGLLLHAGYSIEASGDFDLPSYPLRGWLSLVRSGDVKEAIWRSMQETGGLYGRLIGAGPMLYAVARIS